MNREKSINSKPLDIEPYVATRPTKVPVHVYDLQGHYLRTFESLFKAGKELKVNPSGICLCLKGKAKRAGMYQWRKSE